MCQQRKSCGGHGTLPLRRGSSLFSRMSLASVPSSMRSSLVMTPMVLRPAAPTEPRHTRCRGRTDCRDGCVSVLNTKHSCVWSFSCSSRSLFSNPLLPQPGGFQWDEAGSWKTTHPSGNFLFNGENINSCLTKNAFQFMSLFLKHAHSGDYTFKFSSQLLHTTWMLTFFLYYII